MKLKSTKMQIRDCFIMLSAVISTALNQYLQTDSEKTEHFMFLHPTPLMTTEM
jgi:hypothetical protein